MTTSFFSENFVDTFSVDKRVENWYLMSPIAPTLIFIGYFATVLLILPAFMKNREPYNINKIIRYYNLFQIGACLFLIYGVTSSGWLKSDFNPFCEVVDYSEKPDAVRLVTMVYYTFLLKVIELVETVFFLLRKKDNQVTGLHLYHHGSTFIVFWFGAKFFGGGSLTFIIIINSFIHVLMYSYYFLSSFGPEWQRRLEAWKPRLTMAQMIQFGVLIVQSCGALSPDCKLPKVLMFAAYVPNMILMFYMFSTFYNKSYIQKGGSEAAAKSK